MIKKIILLVAILGPFGLYFLYSWLLKLEKKKIPIVKLSITSIILLIAALGFLRFYGDLIQTLNTLQQSMRMEN